MKRLGLAIILWLAGCSSPQAITPPPTLQPITVMLTPALRPLQAAVHRCAVVQPEIALVLSEVPPTYFDKMPADLFLRLGEPLKVSGYAAALAWESIAIIVHPDNPLKSLDQNQLRELFTGQTGSWKALGGPDQAIQVWTYTASDDTRSFFDRLILGDGSPVPDAMLAMDPAQMMQAIAANPGAIGYVPAAWLTGEVRALDLAPELQAALRQPVLALAPTEPQGAVRRFLACLQNGAGQEELKKNYQP